MKLLYLLPLLLLAACAEEEIPETELVPDTTVELRMTLTCDDCEIAYQVNTSSFYAGRLNSFTFDTLITDLEFSNIGFIDSTFSGVPPTAEIYIDNVLVVDTFALLDTMDFGYVGAMWYGL